MSGTLENGQCPEYGRIVDSLHQSGPAAKLRDALAFQQIGPGILCVRSAGKLLSGKKGQPPKRNGRIIVRPRNDSTCECSDRLALSSLEAVCGADLPSNWPVPNCTDS